MIIRSVLPYDGKVDYIGEFIDENESIQLMKELSTKVNWRHDEIILFGKKITTKRKVYFIGDEGIEYKYSNMLKIADSWFDEIKTLKKKVEKICNTSFNACLLNYYENGSQAMSWHSDNEKELKEKGVIASISLGAKRNFQFKHNGSNEKVSLELENGSLLIMKEETQYFWKHQLPASKKVTSPRINLTFRQFSSFNQK